MSTETKSIPRGGVILSVTQRGPGGAHSDVWCIHPTTHEERIITVWTTAQSPKPGDACWWWPGHSPRWTPKGGEPGSGTYLPRIGVSRDPTQP